MQSLSVGTSPSFKVFIFLISYELPGQEATGQWIKAVETDVIVPEARQQLVLNIAAGGHCMNLGRLLA